jgi:signal transduction histidine kinase
VSQSHTVRVDVEDEVWALADEVAVSRIVDNLLVNAVRYSPEDTVIEVSVVSRDGWAVLVVADDGPGIPVSERALVFERFYRGSHDAVLRTPGSGIGLALVKELAGRMGGRVDIDESERGGARLSVSLLAAPPPR